MFRVVRRTYVVVVRSDEMLYGGRAKRKVSAIHERPVQRYSEVFGLGAEGQGFVVVVNFKLTFSFLVVEVDDLNLF